MANKEEKKRTSVDLTTDNYEALNEFSKMYGSTYGRVMNQMIEIFIRLPLDVKKELADHCDSEVIKLSRSLETAGAFARQELKLKQSTYQQLAYFLSSGKTAASMNNLARTYLKEGYVTYPSTMTVLKTKDPTECMYAGCVEVNNGEKYFIFFSDKKYKADYDMDDINEVYDACIKEYPEMKRILNEGQPVEIFSIYEKNDPTLPNDFEFPFGTVIVRTND